MHQLFIEKALYRLLLVYFKYLLPWIIQNIAFCFFRTAKQSFWNTFQKGVLRSVRSIFCCFWCSPCCGCVAELVGWCVLSFVWEIGRKPGYVVGHNFFALRKKFGDGQLDVVFRFGVTCFCTLRRIDEIYSSPLAHPPSICYASTVATYYLREHAPQRFGAGGFEKTFPIVLCKIC